MDTGQLVGLAAIGVVFVLGMWTGMCLVGARRLLRRGGGHLTNANATDADQLHQARLEGERVGYARGLAERERGTRRRYGPAA